MFHRMFRIIDLILIAVVVAVMAPSSTPTLNSQVDRVRVFTRGIEFDYASWVWNAAWIKLEQNTVGLPYLFDRATNKQIVLDYLQVTRKVMAAEFQIEQVFADPAVVDKETTSAFLRTQRSELLARQKTLAPLAEAALQTQVANILAESHLAVGGQPLPPTLYHVTSTPLALIVSPRNIIQQTTNISLLPTLTLEEQIRIEDNVAQALDVSTLIVSTGGIGVYPTMVTETANLPWLLNTIAHEWAHNYLNLRPLGLNYSSTPETRTMNETAASIIGNEIGTAAVQTYYPELAALPAVATASTSPDGSIALRFALLPVNRFDDAPPFDFRAEMHTTRVHADELLTQGKVEEAEAYMEARRQFFWQNGYSLRKLNQAYFAFFGSYADAPGGAAGEDPVGPAVRAVRAQSDSLADFVNTIAFMTSFDQLKKAIHP